MFSRLFSSRRNDRELDAELRDHVERQAAEYERRGLDAGEARRRALADFGGIQQAAEYCRDVRYGRLGGQLVQDLRYGWRVLRKSPGFAAVAVLSLALGIGAVATIFSFVDAVLLKSLPVRDPGALMLLSQRVGARDVFSFSTPAYRHLAESETISGLCAFRPWPGFRIRTASGAQLATGQLVSGNCFEVLGVSPQLGRLLRPPDDAGVGGPMVAVISDAFWERHFQRDPGIVGRTFDLMGQPFTVVGVTPREFFGVEPGRAVDVTVPLSAQPLLLPGTPLLTSRDARWLRLIARPAPHESRERAATDLARRWDIFESAERRSAGERPVLAVLSGAQGLNDLRRAYSRPLRLLMAAVSLLLLVACVNLASLLLARAKAREHELVLRVALGASRGRIVRQLLTEALLLSTAGALGGLALAQWGRASMLALLSRGRTPVALDGSLDVRLLIFAIVLLAATTVLFGLWPALKASAADPQMQVRAATRSRATSRSTTVLIAAQAALTLVLVAGAALFARSLASLHAVDAGFRKDQMLLVSIRPAVGGAGEADARRLYREVYRRLSRLSGVRAVTVMMDAPLGGRSMIAGVSAAGRPDRVAPQTHLNVVGPRFLETAGIPLLDGRDFRLDDDERTPPVAVVSASLARRLFGSARVVGEQLDRDGQRLTIVGVAADVHYESLRDAATETMYWSYQQEPETREELTFAVRTDAAPQLFVDAVRREVRAASADLPLYNVSTLAARYDGSITSERMLATTSGVLGGLSLLLVVVGVYGTLAYAAAQRTRELGVRLALGAARRDIAQLLLRDALVPVAAGVVIGLPVALAAGVLARGTLFGVSAADPSTYIISSVVLVAAGTLAAVIPARRAANTDPMTALREDG